MQMYCIDCLLVSITEILVYILYASNEENKNKANWGRNFAIHFPFLKLSCISNAGQKPPKYNTCTVACEATKPYLTSNGARWEHCDVAAEILAGPGEAPRSTQGLLTGHRNTFLLQGLKKNDKKTRIVCTSGGRILQMPVFSAMGRILLMYPKGSEKSSQLGSKTGHSGGGTNSANADMSMRCRWNRLLKKTVFDFKKIK